MTRISEDSKSATVSNALLGTVRASEGPAGMHLEAPNATFEGLAGLLTELLRQPVVDSTGLKGRYQVILDLSAPDVADARPEDGDGHTTGAPAPDPRAQIIIAALEEIGLKLESRKIPIETVVVDHLERNPSEN